MNGLTIGFAGAVWRFHRQTRKGINPKPRPHEHPGFDEVAGGGIPEGNVIKFTPFGGKVTVRLERAGPLINLSVTDTGQGIGKEFLPRVFDRFTQADSSHARRHSRLGLGLAIVRDLVEFDGGSVGVRSAERAKARSLP
jgi:nitrogen-specific signal transduction histidine kinase